MAYNFRDHYFQRAKKENYLARAIYKLEEIQKKHRVLRSGDRVLDLGAAPGSWMQLTSGVVGPSGLVVGVDLKKIEHVFPRHVVVLQRDIFDPEFEEDMVREYAPFDVVLSDMAPSTCGIKAADSARSELLFERAIQLAEQLLKPQGHFLAKIFQGSDFHNLLAETKKRFEWVKVVKPEASKKQSKEIYVLAMRFKKP
ncbi:MAG: RlmE family RNA methyltransferase [Desulfobacteraceae bacterium]|nr:RlmE family RNA methyltransferase [Desulfobacteraceae bacterium]